MGLTLAQLRGFLGSYNDPHWRLAVYIYIYICNFLASELAQVVRNAHVNAENPFEN